MIRILSIEERGIYTDLIRIFRNEGHDVYIITPLERRLKEKTRYINDNDIKILNVKTLNIQKTNYLEKALGILLIQIQFQSAIKKYFKNKSYDLIIYSTPPITFTKIIRKIKNKSKAKAYLLLKDIFPQNAVDIGLFSKINPIYTFFRLKEISLYKNSDYIGCMSSANVEYLKKHNRFLKNKPIEVCPNSIEPLNTFLSKEQRRSIRIKYNLPLDSMILLNGGNLGKPQGLDFLLNVIENSTEILNIYFLIIGTGTEYNKINKWFISNKPSNAKLIPDLPKIDYDAIIQTTDVGLIFLDKRFTIPNFPSRLLSYLEFSKPVIAATDINTDLGRIMTENKFGLWCENGDLSNFKKHINLISGDKDLAIQLGRNGRYYLEKNYHVSDSYKIIMKHLLKNQCTESR